MDVDDTNLTIAGLLSDLATAQTVQQKRWGFKQAAAAIRDLDRPIDELLECDGSLPRIHRIGPASTRVIMEVLQTGESPTVDAAVAASDRRAEILQRRAFRTRFLSRARVRTILDQPSAGSRLAASYHGDLQMHSVWSDGSQTLRDIVDTGITRGYRFSAVTDHSGGLRIARGLPHERFVEQWKEIDRLNTEASDRFRLLRGVEANILADGIVDVEPDQRRSFEIVVAAPHSGLRSPLPQTERLVAAVTAPYVHVLGHPRGRIYGTRAGIHADWEQVFRAAADSGVAVEIDGDPFRQDLDYALARQALDAGCVFALDSDAHATDQWAYVDAALAHATLAGIPSDRIINCWPLEALLDWAARTGAGRKRRKSARSLSPLGARSQVGGRPTAST